MHRQPPEAFGWFTPPDIDLLVRALARIPNPGEFVLVGGQALSFWVDYFDIALPKLNGPYLTSDADFCGSRLDAQLLAEALGADIRIATLDDATPNIAVLSYRGLSGEKLLIDVLSGVIGLSDAEIKNKAIKLVRNDQAIHVLHPVLCLVSRCANLHRIPAKRNGNGVSQAVVAVEVVRRFFRVLHANGLERNALKWTKEIRRLGLSPAGIYVYAHYGIDVLAAVEAVQFKSPRFAREDWPNVIRWVDQKRGSAMKKVRRLALTG